LWLVCLCISLSVCPPDISATTPLISTKCLWMLPMAVDRSFSSRVTKSQGERAILGVFFPIDNALYSVAFETHKKTAESIDKPFGMISGLSRGTACYVGWFQRGVEEVCAPPSAVYLYCRACLWHVMQRAIRCADVTFFILTVSSEANLPMCWTNLHQIFRIGMRMGGHDQFDLFSRSFKERYYAAMVTDFGREPAKIGRCALHSVWEDRNIYARVNTADDTSMAHKHMVNFGPVTPEVCRRVCTGRATHGALPCILVCEVCKYFHQCNAPDRYCTCCAPSSLHAIGQ